MPPSRHHAKQRQPTILDVTSGVGFTSEAKKSQPAKLCLPPIFLPKKNMVGWSSVDVCSIGKPQHWRRRRRSSLNALFSLALASYISAEVFMNGASPVMSWVSEEEHQGRGGTSPKYRETTYVYIYIYINIANTYIYISIYLYIYIHIYIIPHLPGEGC